MLLHMCRLLTDGLIPECCKDECLRHGAMSWLTLQLTSAGWRKKKSYIIKRKLKHFPYFFSFQTDPRRSKLNEAGRFKCDSTHCFHSLLLAAFTNSRCYFSNHMEKILIEKEGWGRGWERGRNCFSAFGTFLKQWWYCVDSTNVQQALKLAGGMPRRRQPQDKKPLCYRGGIRRKPKAASSTKWCSVILGLICWEL